MRVQLFVRLKPGVLDVQGKAVEHGVGDLGYKNISDVRIGKLIEFAVEAGTKAEAESTVKELCDKLLVNHIIENYEVRLTDK